MVKVIALDAVSASISPKTETKIAVVLDETGSMLGIKSTTISGLNEFIATQKSLVTDQPCYLNIYKFSEFSKFFPNTNNVLDFRILFENKNIKDVTNITETDYKPEGMTNLYDAIGNTIVSLEKTTTDNQNVLVVIITDGLENSSKEYNSETIKKMIAEKQEKGWTFVYLGANQDAWAVGSSMGLSKGQTMTYSTANMVDTMNTVAAATSFYRSSRSFSSTEEKDFFKGDEK